MWLATSQEEHFKWFHYIFFLFPLIWVRTFVQYLATDVYTEFHILQKGILVQSCLESSMLDKLDVGDTT